jgi:hypothetical protein
MSGWATLFWLILTVAVLYPLNRWITSHIQGVAFLLTGSRYAATWLFWVLFLPGTFLHEVSHWLTAQVLGVRTGRFSLWPKPKGKGLLQMGAVQVEVSDPFRHSLIGLAPLIFGSVAVLLIGWWLGLERIAPAFGSGDPEAMWRAISRLLAIPDIWLWLYLIFTISNAMLPSASDRESWWSVVLYLCLGLMLVIALDVNPSLSPELQAAGQSMLIALFSAFIITIGVDLIFIAVIVVVENLLALLLGRRVQYHL